MPSKKPKLRGNPYLLDRLKNEHPKIYADWKAGKYGSVREAAIDAGLRKGVSHLNELKRHWKKATPQEMADFFRWMPSATKIPLGPIVDDDGRLLPHVADRIRRKMKRDNLSFGDVNYKLGQLPKSPRLAYGLKGRRIDEETQQGVRKWLTRE